MKKKLVIIGILLLTGCGKKLVCTSINSDNTINETYKINYKDNNIISIINEKTYQFKTKEEFKNFENMMIYKVETTNTDNIKVSYKKKNNKYILISKYDTTKLTNEQLKEFGLSNEFDELKNTFKGYGLTCK